MEEKPTSTWLEIAWRWAFLTFAICVLAGMALLTMDAVRLRGNEVAALRSRHPVWVLMALLSLLTRYPAVLGGALKVVLATLAGFWVLAGAAARSYAFGRSFRDLVLLRSISLVAGSGAIAACWAVIMAVSVRRLPPGVSMAVVSLFSLATYFSWRWISLLLAVLEGSSGWAEGWRNFVAAGPSLALNAATNSTLKWVALAAVTGPSVLLLLALAGRGWRGILAWAVGFGWLLAASSISGYFAAYLKLRISEQVKGPQWNADSPNSPDVCGPRPSEV